MIKNLCYISVLALVLSSCSALKPVSSARPEASKSSGPGFIENISVSAAPQSRVHTTSSSRRPIRAIDIKDLSVTESLSSLQFKYGVLLNVPVESLTNVRLLETIDDWYGARYRFGGASKDGVDCSALTCTILSAVFGATIPRTAKEQYAASTRIKKDELREGDLVFFNTRNIRSTTISHVGVYLDNNKFVHASSSGGVMISDMEEDYFRRKYVGAGRVL